MALFTRQSHSTTKIALMAIIYLFCFLLYGLYCLNTVQEVRVNGPHYKRIVQGKDVIADILPPPEYLVETYLTLFELLHSSNIQETETLLNKAKKLKVDYVLNHNTWVKILPDDELKTSLTNDSYIPGFQLVEIMEKEFLPAIEAGNKLLAEQILNNKIEPLYKLHRNKIDVAVNLAMKRNKQDEASASVAVESRTTGQIVIGLFLFFLLVIFSSREINKVDVTPSPRQIEDYLKNLNTITSKREKADSVSDQKAA